MSQQPIIAAGGCSAGWKPSIVAELARVVRHGAVNAEYRHLVLDCSDEAAAAQPGQFFQLLCPHPVGEQPFLRRPMRSAIWPKAKMPSAMPPMVTAVHTADWVSAKPNRVAR
jgi:hypothetical protein